MSQKYLLCNQVIMSNWGWRGTGRTTTGSWRS